MQAGGHRPAPWDCMPRVNTRPWGQVRHWFQGPALESAGRISPVNNLYPVRPSTGRGRVTDTARLVGGGLSAPRSVGYSRRIVVKPSGATACERANWVGTPALRGWQGCRHWA